MALVWPVLAQILLTFAVLVALGRARFKALREGRCRVSEIGVSSEAWPEDVRKVSNNLANQFETPVLFYVLALLSIATGVADTALASLAWVFVALRAVHAWVHVGRNDVRVRFRVFLAAVGVLMLMWAWVALQFLMR